MLAHPEQVLAKQVLAWELGVRQVLEQHFRCWLSNYVPKCHVGVQNQCLLAAGEAKFAIWVQNHEVRAVWGVRRWCWLPKSGVSQAYSNTRLRAGVRIVQHPAQPSVKQLGLTPV